MNNVAFENSIKKAEKLLADINLFGQKGTKSINKDGVSDKFRHASYKDDYFKVFKIGIANFDYDFRLFDDSFFQFSIGEARSNDLTDLRYAFFQNPQDHIEYEKYLDLLREDGLIEDESNEDLGYVFIEEYQQYLIEQGLNSASTSIRYDVDLKTYLPLVHPTAHIHIGHANQIRIPCARVLTPVQFVLFIVRQIYYYQWKGLVECENAHLMAVVNNEKESCPVLTSPYWHENEELDLYLY
jgi:hypothetical protein